jgi:hypothetical protein
MAMPNKKPMLKLLALASLLEDIESKINKMPARRHDSKNPELNTFHPGITAVNNIKHMPAKSLGL